MFVIITRKYEKDPIKSSRENTMPSFYPLWLYGSYMLQSSDPIWLKTLRSFSFIPMMFQI